MNKHEGPSKLKSQDDELTAPNQQQTSEYIAKASLGLGRMAEQADLAFLKYLLDMAADEAMRQSDMPQRRAGGLGRGSDG